MMSKSKRQLLAERKQRLVADIEQQRIMLSASKEEWLQATVPYDRAWQTIMTFRPIFIAATGLISILTLKHPNRFISLSKKAIAAWGLVRTLRNSLNSANQK
ncbi:YqjK-like family protein [Providencia alcalifaciens]|uniref:YqjK-like family protein n=1 Tax=Providencia alcalifaciens TaxID=126385 RepID=UPI001CC70DE0|nr:YqjK-like family protein [Providencia alcalifaciens]CAG9427171.1 hypothetical protein NVI2019_OHEONHNH_02769 [Providencia alcalifaciens]CAG9430927.1 hypothetical protein NVI2019_PLFLNFOB_03264 [Providencia alcalifaciens]CAG9431105.1 hypothetical protein NVI2019_KOLGMIGM_03265 [Providencia alcalifaciens]CAG9432129.1 hypothetical protein NVI2019_OGMBKCAO_03265 [Providencia alcalifaciens]CAG9432368.1 hypothetical protein NVI2019_ANGEOOBF_03264 [Providencia alcalifaciens]